MKQVGPLKAFKQKARKCLKEMTRLNIRHKSHDYRNEEIQQGIYKKYRQYSKHNDSLRKMLKDPDYRSLNQESCMDFEHAKMKFEKRDFLLSVIEKY